ncbi:MAG: AEC family transporter [Kiritimatiellales bacterium]|nr:AEC family transporter [Kiritimatiellales bacterium]
MLITNSIVPIFLLIALGKVLQKMNAFPDAFFKGLNKLVFWCALPALLIISISTAEIDFRAIAGITLLFTAGTLVSLGIAWLAAKRLKLDGPSAGSFIQGSFRGNGAFVGLPVILYTLGTIDPNAEVLSTVVLAPVVLVFNILSVSVLLHHSRHKSSTGQSIATFVKQLIKNPLIMACALGLVLNRLNMELPLFLSRPLDALGKAALPLILISIGSSLGFVRLKGAASPTLIASLLKVAVTPAIGFLLAPLLPLDTTGRMIAIFYLACPTAGMSYVMAEVMGNDAPLAGRIVALSTLLSAITLPIIIAIGL